MGQLKPNDLGLFDMHGNAWEWCQDRVMTFDYPKNVAGQAVVETLERELTPLAANRRCVMRGGSFFNRAPITRCAQRYLGKVLGDPPANDAGFRVARTMQL